MLLLLGVSVTLGRYDTELLSLVIPYVQADIGISEEMVASIFGLSKLGVVVGILIGLLADHFGRVRLLTFTILGFSLATAATAFAETYTQFLGAQFLARAFIDTEAGLVVVIAVETLAPKNRGWALAFGAAFAAIGSGIAALSFAFIEVLPGGWRSLYLLSLGGVFLLAYVRRALPESERFAKTHAQQLNSGIRRRFIAPLHELLTGIYRSRLIWVSAARGVFAFGLAATFALQSKYLIETHGFRPSDITVLFISGGAVAIIGNILGGLLADKLGRKPVLTIFVILTVIGVVGFFSSEGRMMIAFWVLYAFSQFAAGVVLTALEAELFPTKQRATANTLTNFATTIGFAAGALAEGLVFRAAGSHAVGASTLVLILPLAFLIVIFKLPETANRDLDEIAPDDEAQEGLSTA